MSVEARCRIVYSGFSIDESKCNKCMACIDYCPSQAIVLSGNSITINPERCLLCLGCMALCPRRALTIRVKWVCSIEDTNV